MSGHSLFCASREKQQTPDHIPMQTDTTQEQFPNAMPHPLEEFKAKKRDKPITPIYQDGVNCGCFAAGMAIASLIRIEGLAKNTDNKTYDMPEVRSKVEQFGKALAKKIELTAQEHFLSSMGEMFDADSLATAINMVLQDSYFLPPKKVDKYMAKAAQFDTPKQLAELLTRANAMGVRVLIPYLADDDMLPYSRTCSCAASEMYNAHWCCIQLHDGNKSDHPMVQIYEGHQLATAPLPLDEVYQSNDTLAESMDWEGYRPLCNDSEIKDTFAALKKRASKKPNLFQNEDKSLWNSDFPSDLSQVRMPIELAKLRRRIILIGKKADASTHTPAAPAPAPQTATAGGTE